MKFLPFYLYLILCSALHAATAADSGPEALIRDMLLREFPEFKIGGVSPSPIDGLYEVLLGSEVLYVSADGRYIVQGSLFDMELHRNLSQDVLAQGRMEVLARIPRSEIIEFAPEQAKYAVYVFTDIDCGYCRRLHNDIGQLNDRGIAIRYLAFPRNGIDSKTYRNMVSVWCAADRKQALTTAKLGKAVKLEKCDNPVARHLTLGKEAGVSGTPAIFTEQGKYIGGYLSPDEMLLELQGS